MESDKCILARAQIPSPSLFDKTGKISVEFRLFFPEEIFVAPMGVHYGVPRSGTALSDY